MARSCTSTSAAAGRLPDNLAAGSSTPAPSTPADPSLARHTLPTYLPVPILPIHIKTVTPINVNATGTPQAGDAYQVPGPVGATHPQEQAQAHPGGRAAGAPDCLLPTTSRLIGYEPKRNDVNMSSSSSAGGDPAIVAATAAFNAANERARRVGEAAGRSARAAVGSGKRVTAPIPHGSSLPAGRTGRAAAPSRKAPRAPTRCGPSIGSPGSDPTPPGGAPSADGGRGMGWTDTERVVLSRAALKIMSDAVTGTDQSGKVFYGRVADTFREDISHIITGTPKRSTSAITKEFRDNISKQAQRFASSWSYIKHAQLTGNPGEEDLIRGAVAHYNGKRDWYAAVRGAVDVNNKPVEGKCRILPCWRVLRTVDKYSGAAYDMAAGKLGDDDFLLDDAGQPILGKRDGSVSDFQGPPGGTKAAKTTRAAAAALMRECSANTKALTSIGETAKMRMQVAFMSDPAIRDTTEGRRFHENLLNRIMEQSDAEEARRKAGTSTLMPPRILASPEPSTGTPSWGSGPPPPSPPHAPVAVMEESDMNPVVSLSRGEKAQLTKANNYHAVASNLAVHMIESTPSPPPGPSDEQEEADVDRDIARDVEKDVEDLEEEDLEDGDDNGGPWAAELEQTKADDEDADDFGEEEA